MRRLLVVNALIFAVLAAASALAYYSYSATAEQTSNQRERALMQDLAEEKGTNLEYLIAASDTKLMQRIELDKLNDTEFIEGLRGATGAVFAAIYVLEIAKDGTGETFEVVPGGHITTRDSEQGRIYLDWFLSHVLPSLQLTQIKKPDIRDHKYLTVADKTEAGETATSFGRPYLVSYMKRTSGGRTFYIVVEDDITHLTLSLFPQFFPPASKRLYQVVDENGVVRAGDPFTILAEGPPVERKFVDTLDGWVLRVAQRDLENQSALDRKRLVNSVLIGGAVVVILGGLAVLGFAIRRERKLNNLKSEFISNVSHELKTPLSIISMFGEMLANKKTKSPEQAHEYAEIIWRESVRLGRLIDNVLDFAKIERGMDVYEFSEDVDIVAVVERAVELSQRRVVAAEMTITSVIEPEVPFVKLDANAYTLGVLNLIDNAVKYAADGKKIQVNLRRVDDRVVLEVRDWGPGIEIEEQERIFERFYRARSIRLKPIRGSGIGLSLVRHIAKAHGGDVTVASTGGGGSTFSIWLPIDGKN